MTTRTTPVEPRRRRFPDKHDHTPTMAAVRAAEERLLERRQWVPRAGWQ
jgi:hypothetical protein